jgi:hypothetical protein
MLDSLSLSMEDDLTCVFTFPPISVRHYGSDPISVPQCLSLVEGEEAGEDVTGTTGAYRAAVAGAAGLSS